MYNHHYQEKSISISNKIHILTYMYCQILSNSRFLYRISTVHKSYIRNTLFYNQKSNLKNTYFNLEITEGTYLVKFESCPSFKVEITMN